MALRPELPRIAAVESETNSLLVYTIHSLLKPVASLGACDVLSWGPTALRPELPRTAAVESETNSLPVYTIHSLLKPVASIEACEFSSWGPTALQPELPWTAAVETQFTSGLHKPLPTHFSIQWSRSRHVKSGLVALYPELPRTAAVESETNSLHFWSTQSTHFSN